MDAKAELWSLTLLPRVTSSMRSSSRHHRTRMVTRWAMKLLLVAAASAGPLLESFDIDMNLGLLELTFDSAVSNATESIDWTGVSLRTHSDGLEGKGVGLWNTQGEGERITASSSISGLQLTVYVHPTDQDGLKAACVGHNSSFTWIELRPGTFRGRESGDPSEAVYGTQVYGREGMSVRKLVQDTTRPVLEKFVVDRARRELVLFFSETMNVSSTSPSEVSIFTIEAARPLQSAQDGSTVRNFSVACSTARRGPSGSWREFVLKLDEPCPITPLNASLNVPPSSSSIAVSPDSYIAGGYSSDWERLVRLKVFEDEGTDVGTDVGISARERSGSGGGAVMINATSAFMADLAYAANALLPVQMLEESFPDCQPCSNGTFRSEPCTDVYDAKCKACTEACPGGELFALSLCTVETDLSCQQCTQCPFGTREVTPCNATSDRTCEACTECGEGEYESRACSTGGDDRICESCLRCSMSAAVAEACRGYFPVLAWQMEHCCETMEGESVPCWDVALENLRISAREGRRHWVFKPSIPPVDGYSEDYWGKGRVARDGVSPRDGLMEIEFRKDAKSVFDDPRYLDQEGPTLGGPGS